MSFLHKFLFLATLVFGGGLFSTPIANGFINPQNTQIDLVIGIKIQFPVNENDFSTSGNENFILNESLDEINNRCDGFWVDLPPHDNDYFYSQMKAVRNYFNSVSNGAVDFNTVMIDSIITANHDMAYYSSEDTHLGDLFIEGIQGLESEIEEILITNFGNVETGLENSIIVLFHAGIGQDFAVPFLDPTPNDLSSAYIEESMLNEFPTIAGIEVNRGILLPETQNHIYYDVIEQIFYGETDYCDYQVGMTGIFSFLMGYALGLPPLFDTETGDAGVGVFGLMDHGSNNGRGVIPAPPTAWSRIHASWVDPIEINENGTYEISIRNLDDQIIKIPITDDEYFLIEFRDNIAKNNKNIEEIRFQEEDYTRLNWFDVITDSIPELFTISENNVIESVDNYDLGLPETGALIWHITNPTDLENLNSDRENRAVHLEEADGAVDIGFETFNPFITDHITGWGADMWFPRNSQWEFANSEIEDIEFSDVTNPNTKSNSGVKTNIRIFNIEINDSIFTFDFEKESELQWEKIYYDDSYPIGGTDQSVYLFSSGNLIEVSSMDTIVYTPDTHGLNCFPPELNEQFIYPESGYDSCISQPDSIFGFISSVENPEVIESAIAVGDIDLDGLDEIFYFKDNKLFCENGNGTLCNGFPIESGNSSNLLISNIINIINDNNPEIILKDDNSLKIIAHDGSKLIEEISSNNLMPIIIPNWDENHSGLVDGNQIFLFEKDLDHLYWPSKFGQLNGEPISSGNHFLQNNSMNGFDLEKVYNYPNPVKNGSTKFRFFNYNANSVDIKIINSAGQFIESISANNLTHNEYNEIEWQPGKINAGIYLAEVKPNIGEVKIVHVMVLSK